LNLGLATYFTKNIEMNKKNGCFTHSIDLLEVDILPLLYNFSLNTLQKYSISFLGQRSNIRCCRLHSLPDHLCRRQSIPFTCSCHWSSRGLLHIRGNLFGKRGSISPTCLQAAFKCADPKSIKIQSSC